MTRRLAAGTALTVLSGLALTGAVAVAPAQAAVSASKALIVPFNGSNADTVSVALPARCGTGADTFAAVLSGPGLPADGQLVKGATPVNEIGSTGVYRLGISFNDAAADAGTALVAGSNYVVTTFCQDLTSRRVGDDYQAAFKVLTAGATGTYGPATATTTPTTPTTPALTYTVRTSPVKLVIKKGAKANLTARVVSNKGNVARAKVVYYTRNAGAKAFVVSRRLTSDAAGLSKSAFSPTKDFRWYVRYVDASGKTLKQSATYLVQVKR